MPTTTTTHASFNYYNSDRPLKEDDVSILSAAGQMEESDRLKSFSLPVYSIRGNEEMFSLDVHGFCILKHSSCLLSPNKLDAAVDFHNPDLVKSTYWPEITALMQERLGARAAAVINTTVRDIATRDAATYDPKNPRKGPNSSYPPFYIVHGDYTATGARNHLRAVVPTFYEDIGTSQYTTAKARDAFLSLQSQVVAAQDMAMKKTGLDNLSWNGEHYSGPRWAMFSIWRPLSTVHRSPLAILDSRDLNSWVELPRVYRSRPGFLSEYKSTNLIARGPAEGAEHRWYWLPDQRDDEVFAIKLFDSESQKKGGPAFGAAHSAFELEETSHIPPRRSVELRVIVIW